MPKFYKLFGLFAIALVVVMIVVCTRRIQLDKYNNYIGKENWENARKVAKNLGDKDKELFCRLKIAEIYESEDLERAIRVYKEINTDEALERADYLSGYLHYGGRFANDSGDSEYVTIAIREGKLWYTVDDGHYGQIGEPIKYDSYGCFSTYIFLDTSNQELSKNVTFHTESVSATEYMKFVSVNSPQYMDGSYRLKGHDYYDRQTSRSTSKNRPKLSSCLMAGCDRTPVDGSYYCSKHKCKTASCNDHKTSNSSFCYKHSIQYKNSSSKSSGKNKTIEHYDVKSYDSADSFADDKYEEFYDYEDDYDDEDEAYDAAVDYWEDMND